MMSEPKSEAPRDDPRLGDLEMSPEVAAAFHKVLTEALAEHSAGLTETVVVRIEKNAAERLQGPFATLQNCCTDRTCLHLCVQPPPPPRPSE